MALWLHGIVVDSAGPAAQAAFWAAALGWVRSYEAADEVVVEAPEDRPPSLVFVTVPERKLGQDRVHLDLRSTSAAEQQAVVERLLALGARHLDIGQGDVPWVVMADPEGNELCVLEPRPEYEGAGPIAAVVVAVTDPAAEGRFWSEALGWPAEPERDGVVALRGPDGCPRLEFVTAPPARPRAATAKNRVHLDLAPSADGDQADEVRRLEALGARRAAVGQGEVPWVVLSDPEGVLFCVLRPKDWAPR